jgi:hypothetical protein
MWQRLRILHEHGHGLSLIAVCKQEPRRAAFEASPQSRISKDVVLFRSIRWRGVATLLPVRRDGSPARHSVRDSGTLP